MPIKGSVLEAYTQTKRTDICFACALDDMFSDFNTARKAAWLKLTQLECASDRKDSQMLLGNIRESKREGMKHLLHHVGMCFIDMELIRRNKRVLES